MGSHHPIRKTVAPEPVAIPDKLYFRIGDVARLCDVAPYVLRFWETEFAQLKPNKGGTGQRLYRKKDVEMALRIKTLLYEQGYTIPGARQILKTGLAPAQSPLGEPSPAPSSNTPANPGTPPVTNPGAPPVANPGAPYLASEMRAGNHAPQRDSDRGPELRLRAQLAGLRDELQSILTQLSPNPADGLHPAPEPAPKPRLRLVLEPKPALKPTLHLTTQGDLFSAE